MGWWGRNEFCDVARLAKKSVECHKTTQVESAAQPKFQAKLELAGIGPVGHVTSKRRSLEKIKDGCSENLVLMLLPKLKAIKPITNTIVVDNFWFHL